MSVRLTSSLAVLALAAGSAFIATPAQAAPGTTSLAEVLAADGNKLDHTWQDFDIVEKAVYRVLAKKSDSAVAVLADGETPLTAFVPTDGAFRRLVLDLTGDKPSSEAATWRAVRSVADADTLETILLYHVVPGATVTYAQAKQADGVKLETAQGGNITVSVKDSVKLRDRDFDAPNPKVLAAAKDINRGNEQIAHGINRVLRPIDL